jgi:hypothetical protein
MQTISNAIQDYMGPVESEFAYLSITSLDSSEFTATSFRSRRSVWRFDLPTDHEFPTVPPFSHGQR